MQLGASVFVAVKCVCCCAACLGAHADLTHVQVCTFGALSNYTNSTYLDMSWLSVRLDMNGMLTLGDSSN